MSINDMFSDMAEGFGYLLGVEHGFWWWLWIFVIAVVVINMLEGDDKNRKDK